MDVFHFREAPSADSKMVPGVKEIFLVCTATMLGSLGIAEITRRFVAVPIQIPMIPAWSSHAFLFLVSWVWYRIRVAPFLPSQLRSIWYRRRMGNRLLFMICAWFVPLEFILNFPPLHLTFHSVFGDWTSAISILLFEAVFVGLAEEMMMRPAFQLPLSRVVPSSLTVGKISVSHSTLITALMFGSMHLLNITYQPLIPTLGQSFYAFLEGLLFGYYYEHSKNYLGCVLLHNISDGIGRITALFFTIIHGTTFS
ncbi:MAG: CPBP family intramembrane metalloprotease [Alicyclobacillus macrosporangiidus]|uniref:CPBP family intramembrane glutamic endopeptidase n=1 Tax=Alicyclobacillus macrosporangiidus TaxID=392015 RepID=UPI0026F14940|nr:CPBP family intramembrane glutamic endopeptidase [Alicyclobacillus macrosporangiidus]MCL6600864.1 CPBP family intramembrane metalloprotease [Alicyclobacillus macrosporangiidus]